MHGLRVTAVLFCRNTPEVKVTFSSLTVSQGDLPAFDPRYVASPDPDLLRQSPLMKYMVLLVTLVAEPIRLF